MIAFPVPAPVPTLPIPIDGEVSPIVTVLFALAGLAVFAVIVWQAVRYFRNDRDDDGR